MTAMEPRGPDQSATPPPPLVIAEDQNGLRAVMAATLDNIDAACRALRRYLRGQGLYKDVFTAELLAREAMTNAVLHGCGRDPGKRVVFELRLDPGEIILRVEDQGPGFNWRASTQCPVEATEERGRGLCIMRTYASFFSFNEPGNAVTIHKTLSRGSQL